MNDTPTSEDPEVEDAYEAFQARKAAERAAADDVPTADTFGDSPPLNGDPHAGGSEVVLRAGWLEFQPDMLVSIMELPPCLVLQGMEIDAERQAVRVFFMEQPGCELPLGHLPPVPGGAALSDAASIARAALTVEAFARRNTLEWRFSPKPLAPQGRPA